MQKESMANPEYMDGQEELQWKMRAILNDWIIEVHSKFRLLPETLFIATNLIDRFLSLRMVSLVKFQLVGLTALFVAAKYEEVVCPSITHFLHMTDGGYDVSEILRAERYLLQTLNFDISYPNPLHFLRRVSKADGYDVHARTVAKFFIEISCVEHRLLPYPPSMLAAAAMWLARLCLDRGPWHANMVHYSEYAQHEVLPCAQIMLDYVLDKDMDTTSAFFKKYASKKHLKASIFVRDWASQRWPESFDGDADNLGSELVTEFPGEEQAPLPTPATP
jgi:G2/mitotic-specific cyclin 1/2